MDTSSENYRFVETAAMDLNGTGKKEYVAHLGYNRSQGRLELYVTDANNSRVTSILYLNSDNIGQLSSLDTYQVPGSIALAAGDFDGDGRDTLVVYFPDVKIPTIQEYSVTDTNIQEVSTVMWDVAIELGIPARYDPSANRENQAMVSLVAEDADLDGFDELVVTAGMNDVQTSYHDQLDDGRLGSQLFIYDYSKTNGETDWHESFHTDLTTVTTGSGNTAADAGRLVWASSTVGNVVASTATTTADYPEIIAAGYVDSQGGGNITMKDGGGALGVVTVQVSGQESETLETGVHVDPEDSSSAMAQNVVGQYGVLYRQEVEANSFTSSGAYDEDCWGLLQVQAFADRGVGAEESVFISGSLYESGDQGLVEKDLEIAGYYFDEADSYAQWSSSVNGRLKQTVVLDVVAGNFDGNDAGREQILCVTGLKKYYYQYESYEEDGDEQESVDSSRLTVMTRSENAADVEILLFGAQDDGSYPTSGAEVNLSVEAIVTADYQYNTSYQWQILRPDNWKDGISNWTNLSANEEGIESVEASQNSLRLTGLDSSLDGARLRCRVTVPTSDATPNYYYSDAVTLEISLDSTETSLSLSGSADDRAAGSLDDPYTGNAGYSITTTTSTSGEVEQDVAIPAGESHPALKVYSYTAGEESTPVYVGVGTDEGETVYYAVTKTETAEGSAAYTVGDKLTLGGTKWVKATASGSGTEEYTVPKGYDGTIETAPSTGYRRMALVKTEDSSTTFTEYWMLVPAGDEENADTQYFTKQDGTFEPADLTPQQEEALRYVYVGSGEEVLIVNAAEEGSDGPGADDDRYVTYAVSGGTLSAPTVFWGEADTGLYATDGEGQETLYAGSTGLTVERETVTQEQTSTTTASYGGTEITVAAKTTVDTSILFTFANLTTGGSESVQAGADGTATWQAAVPGMYRVTATAQATETAASSTSAALYYYAGSVSEGTTTEYRLVVSKGSAPASSMVYDGSSVALTLQSRSAATAEGGTVTSPSGSWQDVEDNVSYTVLNLSGSDGEVAAMEGSAYRPQAAGTYRFTASLGGAQVATAQLEVTRAEITIAPAWEGMEDETVPAELDDIQLTASGGFLEEDQALLERAIAIQCGLYGSDGAIRDVGGVYDVTLSYKSDGEGAAAAAELQSKYNITLESGEITYLSHSAVVNYSAGENGTLQAQYVENSEYGFVSGASIPVGYGLRFVATPAVGFQFAEWTVTLNGTAVAWEDEALQGIVTFTETESAAILRVSSLEALIQAVQGESEGSGEDAAPVLQVQAAFTSQNRTVTFSADESTPNGTVTAQQNGQSLNSGVSVAHGSSMTFTATPNEGYVVESWVVNGRVEQNPDGTHYTGTTLEREITEDTEVKVTFTAEGQYAVSYEVVDENNQPVSGVAVTAEGLTDGKATKGGNVAFVAQPSVGVVIQRWEVQRSDGDWETVSASANRYTLYNVQADTNVRIVASGGSNRYTLTFGVVDDTSSPLTGGTLTATSNGVTLETGTEYPSYTNVDFTFTEAEAYEVVEWKVNTDTVQEGRDRLTYTLESPSADTTVNVVVREKPSVTVKEVSNGTVDVTYTLDGETVQPSGNGYVYTGTGISVTLAPATGYVVDAGEMEATYGVDLSYTDGSGATTDNMTYTLDNVQSDVTIAPVWEQLAAYTVGYYVVDTIGDGSGTHGALSASVERKGMDSYENSEFVSGNTVYDGSTVTFTASPENGYIVQEWQVDGEAQAGDTSNTLTLSASELTADTTVTVQFREIGDKVTISAGENGEITSAIAGGVDQIDNMETGFTLDEGASVTITAQPETGYEGASWSVNGERIENTQGQNTFTYTSQSANTGAAISVEFQQVTYGVSWSAAGGTVTADGYTGTSADIRGGTEVSFTAEPAYGYELTGWTVNGEPQSPRRTSTTTSMNGWWTASPLPKASARIGLP